VFFGGSATHSPATLVFGGHEPSGRTWYAIVNPDPVFPIPGTTEPCYGVGGLNAYDEGSTIVVRAPTAETDSYAFGVRLPKAPGMSSPFPNDAPWYGPRFGICLDSEGRVAAGAY